MKMTIDKILRKLYSDNNIQYYTKIIRYTDEDNNTVRLLTQNKECYNTMYNSHEVVARALAKTCIDIILKTEDAKMARFAVNETGIKIAERLGLAYSTFSNYISGKRNPKEFDMRCFILQILDPVLRKFKLLQYKDDICEYVCGDIYADGSDMLYRILEESSLELVTIKDIISNYLALKKAMPVIELCGYSVEYYQYILFRHEEELKASKTLIDEFFEQ